MDVTTQALCSLLLCTTKGTGLLTELLLIILRSEAVGQIITAAFIKIKRSLLYWKQHTHECRVRITGSDLQ